MSIVRTIQPPLNKAMYFNGVNAYVEVPISPLTDKVTVEAWVYHIDGQPSGYFAGIVSNLNGKSNFNRFLITSTAVLFQLSIGGTIYNHQKTGLPSLRNAWHHYVATYDGTIVKLFLDGEEIYSGSQTGNLDSETTKPTIGWGSTSTSYYHLKGMSGKVRIYNQALSRTEIRHNMLNPNNPIRDGLVLWIDARACDASKNVCWDLSGNGNHGTMYNVQIVTLSNPVRVGGTL